MTFPATSNISIIIPTFNEEEHIGELLNSLQDVPGIETIVADGGSHDRTLSIARTFPVRIVRSQQGRGYQQNEGASIATQPILLFLHCDTLLPANFTEEILRVLHQPATVAGAFRLQIDAPGRGFRIVEWGANARSRLLGLPYGDQAIFTSQEAFANVNGFPAQPFLEDVEFIRRLKRIGRVRIAEVAATTSARRWKKLGLWKATLVNQLILIGYACGIDAVKLGNYYRKWTRSG